MKKSKLEKYSRSADMGDSSAGNFVNYGVSKKAEGAYGTARILIICAYIIIPTLIAGTLMYLNFLPILATLPVFIWMFVYFTWRYVSVEYEYCILDGELRMFEVYGSKSMRALCRTRVSAMTAIAPYDHAHRAQADAFAADRRLEAVSSMSAPDIYYAIFKAEDGEDCVLFFEATEKTLRVLRYYNSCTVTVKTRY